MKKYLLIFFGIGIIGFGSYYLYGNKQHTKSQVQAASSQTISMSELSQHNSAQSCWMAIDGKVYDVTNYVNAHPGGSQILRGCGTDATELYNTHGQPGGAPHSGRAQRMLQNYLIGTFN